MIETAAQKRHPSHLLAVVGQAPATTPPMTARPVPGGPGGQFQDQDGDFPQDLADVIQTLMAHFPGDPRVEQIVALIRALITSAGTGAPQGGMVPNAGAAGPGV